MQKKQTGQLCSAPRAARSGPHAGRDAVPLTSSLHVAGKLQIACRLPVSETAPTATRPQRHRRPAFAYTSTADLLLLGATPAHERAAAVSSHSNASGITRPPGGRRRVRPAMPILGARPCAAACSSGATEPISMHQRVDTSQAGENRILNASWWSGRAARVDASVHNVAA